MKLVKFERLSAPPLLVNPAQVKCVWGIASRPTESGITIGDDGYEVVVAGTPDEVAAALTGEAPAAGLEVETFAAEVRDTGVVRATAHGSRSDRDGGWELYTVRASNGRAYVDFNDGVQQAGPSREAARGLHEASAWLASPAGLAWLDSVDKAAAEHFAANGEVTP